MLSSLSPTLSYINKTKNINFSTSNIVYGKRLSKLAACASENYNLSTDLQNSLIGLLLGDASAVKRSISGNTYFEQGFVHNGLMLFVLKLKFILYKVKILRRFVNCIMKIRYRSILIP